MDAGICRFWARLIDRNCVKFLCLWEKFGQPPGSIVSSITLPRVVSNGLFFVPENWVILLTPVALMLKSLDSNQTLNWNYQEE